MLLYNICFDYTIYLVRYLVRKDICFFLVTYSFLGDKMKWIQLVLQGIIIGIAKVIPGVSGSLLAVTLGVYEQGIEAICNFWRKPKQYIPFLGVAGIGILIGILFTSKVLSYFLIEFYGPTMLLFLGLILGTLQSFCKQYIKWKWSMIFVFLGLFFFFFFLNQASNSGTFIYKDNWLSKWSVLGFGFIDATTMIIPGISGTAIFVLLGCYPFILNLFANLPFSIFQPYSFYFGIGLFFGILLVTKLIQYCFSNYSESTYRVIGLFTIVSILFLSFDILSSPFTIVSFLISVVLFFTGFILGKKFG